MICALWLWTYEERLGGEGGEGKPGEKGKDTRKREATFQIARKQTSHQSLKRTFFAWPAIFIVEEALGRKLAWYPNPLKEERELDTRIFHKKCFCVGIFTSDLHLDIVVKATPSIFKIKSFSRPEACIKEKKSDVKNGL